MHGQFDDNFGGGTAGLISGHHIDLIVSAALDMGARIAFEPLANPEPMTPAQAGEVARLLLAEHLKMIVCLHGERCAAAIRGRQQLDVYRFQHYPGVRSAEAAKAARYYYTLVGDAPGFDGTLAGNTISRFLSWFMEIGQDVYETFGVYDLLALDMAGQLVEVDSEDAVKAACATAH